MTLKTLVSISVCTVLLLGAGAAHADGYHPGDFLMLDLNQAALSPKPLGPSTRFEPVPIKADADSATDAVKAAPAAKVVRAPTIKPHLAARQPVAPRRTNPLDANATDIRVQVWPCRSGGICNWRR